MLPGLTDEEKPRLRGPKRASKIRKLFNLTKDDDVRKYVNVFRKVILFSDPFSDSCACHPSLYKLEHCTAY